MAALTELRLQQKLVRGDSGGGRSHAVFFASLERNGWVPCLVEKHGHTSPETAVECLRKRLGEAAR